ncbi:MAG: hypothetical protein ACLR56_01110 [Oscillospiraceae bacterium]
MIKRLCLTISSLIFLTCLSACGGTGDSIKNDRRFMVSALGFEADGFLIKVTAELIVLNSENPEVSPEARVFSAKAVILRARLRRYPPVFQSLCFLSTAEL